MVFSGLTDDLLYLGVRSEPGCHAQEQPTQYERTGVGKNESHRGRATVQNVTAETNFLEGRPFPRCGYCNTDTIWIVRDAIVMKTV